LKNFLEIKTRNIAQGMSDPRENTSPIAPAVDGIDINTPEMIPRMAVVLPKLSLRNMIIAKINNVMAFKT
jgi:hypothetical protein